MVEGVDDDEGIGDGDMIDIPASTLIVEDPVNIAMDSVGEAAVAVVMILRRPPVRIRTSSSCVRGEFSSSTAIPVCDALLSPITLSERLRPPQST